MKDLPKKFETSCIFFFAGGPQHQSGFYNSLPSILPEGVAKADFGELQKVKGQQQVKKKNMQKQRAAISFNFAFKCKEARPLINEEKTRNRYDIVVHFASIFANEIFTLRPPPSLLRRSFKSQKQSQPFNTPVYYYNLKKTDILCNQTM